MSSQQPPRQQPQPGTDRNTEYLDQITTPDVERERLPGPVRDLLSADYPLANINRNDREFFRLLSENVAIYTQELYPPKESLLQGVTGAALLEDPSYQYHALDEQRRVELETALMDAFARSSRGLGGWQQDKLSESIQTSRVEDDRPDDGQGWLSGLFR